MMISSAIAQLRTTDLAESTSFYATKLGLTLEFQYQDFYAGIRAGNHLFHLKLSDEKDPSIEFVDEGEHFHLYLETVDASTAASALKRNGVPLVKDLHAGARYGFHRDELLTYSNARDLEWGFVVYPPVTAFLARIELALFGTYPVPLFTLRRAPRDTVRKTRGPAVRYSFLVGIFHSLLMPVYPGAHNRPSHSLSAIVAAPGRAMGINPAGPRYSVTRDSHRCYPRILSFVERSFVSFVDRRCGRSLKSDASRLS